MQAMAAPRILVAALYLPVLGALALLAWQCLFLLLHDAPAGLFGLLYAGAAFLLGRRAARIVRGVPETPRLWLDAVLLLAADVLIGVLWLAGLAA